ncbi:MAG: cbb3-type cytochrome c oxidase subunit II [bacterium]
MEIRNKDYAFLVAFASATFLSIVFMTVILPNLVFNPKPSEYVVDLTAEQLKGREIYKREGCWYCHTQFVRPQDRNDGPVALAGDYEFLPSTIKRADGMGVQLNHLLGTERTGPDLSLVGGKMPDAWHIAHHSHPQAFNPGSLMPSFDYLSEEDMSNLVAYVQTLGAKKNQEIRKYSAEYKGNMNEAYLQKGAEGTSLSYLVEPEVPWEFKNYYEHKFQSKNPISWTNRYIAGSRGIFNNKCAVCHGVQGDGQGPRALSLTERPANFQSDDPNMGYDEWSDIKWFWKISEGAGTGAIMPRWNGVLLPEQIWYLVNYCKYLANDRIMPDAPRDDPNRIGLGEGKRGYTYHFDGDDLVTGAPEPPAGVPTTMPQITLTPESPVAVTPEGAAPGTTEPAAGGDQPVAADSSATGDQPAAGTEPDVTDDSNDDQTPDNQGSAPN